MNNKSLLWAILLVMGLGLFAFTGALSAIEIPGKEAPLNPNGQVHELFRDGQGNLWISDYFAGEIWRVNSLTGQYTVYEGLDGASSAFTDNQGNLWWSEFDSGAVGNLPSDQGTAKVWSLPEDSNPLGLVMDGSGKLWVTVVFDPYIYRIDTNGNQLCQYRVPADGAADYLQFHNNYLWIGDTINGRILRLNPVANTYTVWQLAEGAYPQGMAVDGDRLWYADYGLGVLGRLNPATNQITTYTIPGNDAEPQMVAHDQGKIWYSDFSGRIGLLDPQLAQGTTTTLTTTNVSVEPSCSPLGQSTSVTVTTRNGSMAWRQTTYNFVQNGGGWLIADLPVGSRPWGVVANGGNAWFVDQGNGVERSQYLGFINAGEPEPTVHSGFVPITFK